MKRDIYQEVTDKIISELEQGTAPWVKPWKGGRTGNAALPHNHKSKRAYNGINTLLLWGDILHAENQRQEILRSVTKLLEGHGVEIWEGYAVEQYTSLEQDAIGRPVYGESFVPLTAFDGLGAAYEWLGY